MGTRHKPNHAPYGSFGNTKIKQTVKSHQHAKVKHSVNNKHVENENDDEDDTTDDIDSGMSSEENEDSLKSNLSHVNNDSVDKEIKCLIEQYVEGNEIPGCSNSSNVNEVNDISQCKELNKVSDFIVIDVTCDVDDLSELSRSEDVVTNSFDCDDPSDSVESLSLVPVGNNEIVRRENQKLLSLSLSILLAALLQAMRCFAQFLEDIIVIPHR